MNTRYRGTSLWRNGLLTDLVELQIKVARGEALEMKQEDLKIKGHAMETGVCRRFYEWLLPLHLDVYQLPVGDGIRVDNVFEADIPIYYDPMLPSW
jgi:propionyl-CoA carboxylase alpha chain